MKIQIQRIDDDDWLIFPNEIIERHQLKVGDELEVVETESGIALKPVHNPIGDGPKVIIKPI
ncbi:AbrB/MazE/SpoVT family DNA-binding domain-containing protein [Phyllobacterium zundukense]|uniref:SpoVT-AbrB domain-containing protein n=1 Tax=Phyllobacterium zundukense TaxID=1867719 RepID=A0A2N9VR47_9HYPH|nr:AbrB/MazE/SpoVT family DNA-binding domain-containing protein [Phyllobacterium zundukense]ATU92397.1 hypothetical protein BLM14_12720 [Phyllobacterium zundukense]PIO41965.1 hypothetical protein B5P45_23170 [Phyllobacterium zundukense]